MANIISLHRDLAERSYRHSSYEAFNISDPKPRNIHKASVRDRLLHHAIYRVLYPYFDNKFFHDSYSCRLEKGTHKAIKRLGEFAYRESKNHTRTVWILKCDIRRFFATIDHAILKSILEKHISDKDTLWLLGRIISSFDSDMSKTVFDTGLPLGNLTSQLLVNIYMNEFDQFVKRELKVKHYIRFADDFVILSQDRNELCTVYQYIVHFLETELKLTLHPDKVFLKTLSSGVDFLGWVNFPDHRVIRTVTRRRVMKGLKSEKEETVQSYLGLLKHGNTATLVRKHFSPPSI
jgi:retron-type reverse transcriptase